MGRILQRTDNLVKLTYGRLPVVGMPVFKVIADVSEIRRGGGRPSDAHLRVEHPLQACVHFFFLDELAPVGLCNTFPNSGPEAGIFMKQAQRGILYQAFRLGAR